MHRSIDYYFSLVSPWAYIGHATFMNLTQRHSLDVNFKPVSLPTVFAETGGLPLNKRAPARQRYRIMELQRWREKRGERLNVHPKFWPFNVGVWADERNLADEQTLVMLADGVGLPAQKLLADAKSESVKKRYQKNIKEALEIDAFGSPCYVLDGEVFWGQDRIELLDDALTSGRKAYRNDI